MGGAYRCRPSSTRDTRSAIRGGEKHLNRPFSASGNLIEKPRWCPGSSAADAPQYPRLWSLWPAVPGHLVPSIPYIDCNMCAVLSDDKALRASSTNTKTGTFRFQIMCLIKILYCNTNKLFLPTRVH